MENEDSGTEEWKRSLAFAEAVPVPQIDQKSLPKTPGVYTIWEDSGMLVYAGLAGVRWTSESPKVSGTLHRRLRDHLSAHRADVLTSYLFERRVCEYISLDEVRAMATGKYSIRDQVLDYLHDHALVTWVCTTDYLSAKRMEDAVRSGALGCWPLINPLTTSHLGALALPD